MVTSADLPGEVIDECDRVRAHGAVGEVSIDGGFGPVHDGGRRMVCNVVWETWGVAV